MPDCTYIAELFLFAFGKLNFPFVLKKPFVKYLRMKKEKTIRLNQMMSEKCRNELETFVAITPDWVLPYLDCGGECHNV